MSVRSDLWFNVAAQLSLRMMPSRQATVNVEVIGE